MSVLSVTFTCPACGHVEHLGAAAPPVPSAPQTVPNAETLSSGKPLCPQHGPMFFREGTNKSGKPYAGFFCTVDGCSTTPVWQKVK